MYFKRNLQDRLQKYRNDNEEDMYDNIRDFIGDH